MTFCFGGGGSEENSSSIPYLYDNYSHIVGCLIDGFIIPILPTSYDYNDIILNKINLRSYYEIKPGELENAKNMILFLENIFLVLKLYNKGSKFNIIRKICTPLAYKPKVCITPNYDNKIESIITYTNQVIKCSITTIKKNDFEKLYSKYEFMRASFFEIEKGLNKKVGQTKESQTKTDHLVKSIELFEKNHHSLPKLEYYYNRNKEDEALHSITIKYKSFCRKWIFDYSVFPDYLGPNCANFGQIWTSWVGHRWILQCCLTFEGHCNSHVKNNSMPLSSVHRLVVSIHIFFCCYDAGNGW